MKHTEWFAIECLIASEASMERTKFHYILSDILNAQTSQLFMALNLVNLVPPRALFLSDKMELGQLIEGLCGFYP